FSRSFPIENLSGLRYDTPTEWWEYRGLALRHLIDGGRDAVSALEKSHPSSPCWCSRVHWFLGSWLEA
ncbi:hypothetical protein, partial [Mesorhizobium sp. M4B.F.Ca.ET.049.02.1.2]|uniref:hypothetical protein n=1 Tax=Mesorhizobium sp. M4B.F.Ca.ET.049.02.1.2 TaxID=2496752 RepID=UPI001AECA309